MSMLAHCVGKSWQVRYGLELGKQEPIATLSAATLELQTTSMLQASCWPTWPSFPSVNQAALTPHLYRGQALFYPMQIHTCCPAPWFCSGLNSKLCSTVSRLSYCEAAVKLVTWSWLDDAKLYLNVSMLCICSCILKSHWQSRLQH